LEATPIAVELENHHQAALLEPEFVLDDSARRRGLIVLFGGRLRE
jgi:hypothetical protein